MKIILSTSCVIGYKSLPLQLQYSAYLYTIRCDVTELVNFLDMDEVAGNREWTPQCMQTPVKVASSVDNYSGQQKTPLNRLQQLVHSSVQLLAGSSPGSHRTPECSGSALLYKDGRSNLRTPLSIGSSGSVSSRYYNPFELGLIDTLHQPVFSPNVFKAITPGSSTAAPTFQWTIDEIAILRPVDMEVPLHHDLPVAKHNCELEQRAQRAIDAYFASHVIAPSPWTDSSKKKTFKVPCTPGANNSAVNDSPMIFSGKPSQLMSRSSPLCFMPLTDNKKMASDNRSSTVATQTAITIPVDFDLQAILGQHCKYNDVQGPVHQLSENMFNDSGDVCNQDMSSNSSLRRKLFFHGDEGTPISPVRFVKHRDRDEVSQSPSIFVASPKPVVRPASGIEMLNMNDSLSLDQFSSSPIKVLHTTPTVRRCSTAPQLMESPMVSPISANYYYSSTLSNDNIKTPVSGTSAFGVVDFGFRPLSSPSNAVAYEQTVTPVSSSSAFRRKDACQPRAIISANSHTSATIVGVQPTQFPRVCHPLELSAFVEETSSEVASEVCSRLTDEDSGESRINVLSQSTSQYPVTDNVATLQTDTGYLSNILQSTGLGTSDIGLCTSSIAPLTVSQGGPNCPRETNCGNFINMSGVCHGGMTSHRGADCSDIVNMSVDFATTDCGSELLDTGGRLYCN